MERLDLQFFGGRGASSASGGGSSLAGIKKGKEAAPLDALSRVNIQNYNKGWEYKENCQRCVWAYELQRRGYDVEALPTYKGDTLPENSNWLGITQNYLGRSYVGAKYGQPNSIKTEVANATDVMRGWGEGSRGIMRVAWSQTNGHVFNVEYKNGKITAFDAQSGKTYFDLGNALKGTKRGYTQILRSDNAVFKESEISKYVKPRGK